MDETREAKIKELINEYTDHHTVCSHFKCRVCLRFEFLGMTNHTVINFGRHMVIRHDCDCGFDKLIAEIGDL